MPEPITKHAFVDDNPYIAYTGEPETAVSGGSGGGGTFICVRTGEKLNVSYNDIKNMIKNGVTPYFENPNGGYNIIYFMALNEVSYTVEFADGAVFNNPDPDDLLIAD